MLRPPKCELPGTMAWDMDCSEATGDRQLLSVFHGCSITAASTEGTGRTNSRNRILVRKPGVGFMGRNPLPDVAMGASTGCM